MAPIPVGGRVGLFRQIALLWVFSFAILLAGNASYYFGPPRLERGDYASNAMDIHYAKRFQCLTGNGSRWGFKHTGPFFFYVYALGESVAFDGLRLVKSAHAAHALFGLGLQCLFFSVGLVLLSTLLQGASYLWIALGCLVALVHFGNWGGVFYSIWPPHVLALPFFSLCVSVLAVANGRLMLFPWAVFCGGALVHGHVVQPLFVFPLLCFSLVQYRRRFGLTHTNSRHVLWPTLAVAGVFALPLLLDLLLWDQSNFARILTYFNKGGGEPKSPLRAALHLVSYFIYANDPPFVFPFIGYRNLLAHLTAWLGWLFVGCLFFGACFTVLWKNGSGFQREQIHSDVRSLGVILTVLLFIWGLFQDHYTFNSFFITGILYGVLIYAFGVWLIRWYESSSRVLIQVGLAGACLLAGPWFIPFSNPNAFATYGQTESKRLQDDVRVAIGKSAESRSILLLGDLAVWERTFATGLELLRQGHAFFVPVNTRNFFGDHQGADGLMHKIASGQVDPWYVTWTGEAQDGTYTSALRTDPLQIGSGQNEFVAGDLAGERIFIGGWDLHSIVVDKTKPNLVPVLLFFRAEGDVTPELSVEFTKTGSELLESLYLNGSPVSIGEDVWKFPSSRAADGRHLGVFFFRKATEPFEISFRKSLISKVRINLTKD